MPARPSTVRGRLISLWAIGGVLGLLAQAIVRLLPRALEPLRDGSLDAMAALAYVGAIGFMAYGEGYRGFQQRFSPRAVVRALHLGAHPRPLLVVAAPVFAMGLIHASRRRLIGSWVLLLAIVGLIVAVSQLAQPWRGAIDAGVVVGLTWGGLATAWLLVQGLRGHPPAVDPELPES